MDDYVKRRVYTAPGRRARADATRRRIADAAAELFASGGYAATSTRAVASAADVSEASVFANFGSKARLLESVIVDRVTADPDFPLAERGMLVPGMPRADAAATFARIVRRAHERSWRLLAAGLAAADDDPDLATTMRHGAERRLADIRWFAAEVLDADAPGRVAEGIWAVGAVEPYRQLVVERGWTPGRYEEWLARMVLATAGATPPNS
ncbi:MAG TPA: helix-turn-helix domain-containing protein [Microbacterium sp.]|nr:helix-turn-helix domain-containing protein [Microbacterium sp.]